MAVQIFCKILVLRDEQGHQALARISLRAPPDWTLSLQALSSSCQHPGAPSDPGVAAPFLRLALIVAQPLPLVNCGFAVLAARRFPVLALSSQLARASS